MRRPQFALSTILFASIFAGVLMWLNVRDSVLDQRYASYWYIPYDTNQRYFPSRGWPWTWEVTCLLEGGGGQVAPHRINESIPYNVAACLALLIITTIAVEWLTRRLKRRASIDNPAPPR
jgi:hypothetical protein